jgi:hypothetical protein
MNHFRPELYLQTQPTHEWATIEAAMAAWDKEQEDYEAELKRDWDRFPMAVRLYLDSIRLHDGVLVADGPTDEDHYQLVVRTDTLSGEYVEFLYSLTEPPEVVDAGFPADLRSDTPHGLYDEFAADPVMPLPTTPGFTHSILLSDGRTLRVRFRDLELRRFTPLLTGVPAPA